MIKLYVFLKIGGIMRFYINKILIEITESQYQYISELIDEELYNSEENYAGDDDDFFFSCLPDLHDFFKKMKKKLSLKSANCLIGILCNGHYNMIGDFMNSLQRDFHNIELLRALINDEQELIDKIKEEYSNLKIDLFEIECLIENLLTIIDNSSKYQLKNITSSLYDYNINKENFSDFGKLTSFLIEYLR